jgi:hypothetical protein
VGKFNTDRPIYIGKVAMVKMVERATVNVLTLAPWVMGQQIETLP